MADAEPPLTILYFAWLRERTGTSQESVILPAEVGTVGELIAWLATRSPGHASAFANRRTVRCAEMDGVARENEVSLFEEMEVPESHATLTVDDHADVVRAVEAGFKTIKLKGGRDLERLAEFFDDMAGEFPSVRWRLDFNETCAAEAITGFLNSIPKELRRRIAFLEDPCPYAESTWSALKQTTGVRLAVDREAAPICSAAQVMVLKPL